MKSLSRFAKRPFLTISLVFLATILLAQPGPPPDPDAPITGIEILMALGGFLGIKKICSSNKIRK